VILTSKPNLAAPLSDSDLNDVVVHTDAHDADEAFDGDELFDDLAPIHLELAPDACGHRLDKVISKLVPQYSRSRLQLWLEAGFVTVDGKVAKRNMTAYGDEKIVILPQSAPEDEAFKPEAMELNIVHEDEHIIVINKPAGLVVHPGPGNWSGTLLNGLLHHCPQLAGVPRAGIVHRLDKDTSGLMVVGKTLASQTDLVRQLQARTVKREYFALVWGTPKVAGTIDASIARHPRDRVKMAVSENFTAKPAITHYELIGSGELDRRPVSLMQCRLETGRTHQIRVHMQHLGFALVGDYVYGKPHLVSVFPRQALQARRLGLVHPGTRENCEWLVPLADDFAELIAQAGIPEPELA
jgi:23S rRNA pseudouridine1911/1915/1917 synthase